MKKLMVTRFNNETWAQHQRWREKNDYQGCIYNAPVYIKENIPLMLRIYVIEMNNDTNKIIGIGRILNKVHTDRKYKIYEDQNYNRFTYRGKRRVERDEIEPIDLEKMEKRLFKSKGHLKRGQGITRVPEDVTNEYLKLIDSLF
jgi:hypothetical protein